VTPPGLTTSAHPRVARPRVIPWRWPWLYEALFLVAPVSRRVRAKEIAGVMRRIDLVSHPSQRVAEVGCGPGTYTGRLASRFVEVTALDSAAGMVEHTTRRMRREGHRNVTGGFGSVPDALGAARGADGLVAVGLLDFADDLEAWLRALRACVVPGGWLVFTVPYARTVSPRSVAGEGILAGRVRTQHPDAVHRAAAAAGLDRVRISPVVHGGRTYTLVVSAVAPGPAGGDSPR
jgi:SAM-dependent methyltransferase